VLHNPRIPGTPKREVETRKPAGGAARPMPRGGTWEGGCRMRSAGRRALGALVCGAAIVLLGAGQTQAADDDDTLKLLKERLDRLEKQNEELRQKLDGGVVAPYKAADPDKEKVNKMIDFYLKDKEKKGKEKKKTEDAKKDAEKKAKDLAKEA